MNQALLGEVRAVSRLGHPNILLIKNTDTIDRHIISAAKLSMVRFTSFLPAKVAQVDAYGQHGPTSVFLPAEKHLKSPISAS